MFFDIVGPFELTRHGTKKRITERSLADLRSVLEDHRPGLAYACGCYVFALRAARGYTPYYAGQACRQSILREALNSSNQKKYNRACSENNERQFCSFSQCSLLTGALDKRAVAALPLISWNVGLSRQQFAKIRNSSTAGKRASFGK
jgi:hypothetical protein